LKSGDIWTSVGGNSGSTRNTRIQWRSKRQWRRQDLARGGARNYEKIMSEWHTKILWNSCN